MFNKKIGIRNLPQELLLDTFVLVALDDLSSLAQAAQSCRAFRNIIYHEDQMLWRVVHNCKYDNPRFAAAFLRPRYQYDWRQRVVDREFALQYLAEKSLPENLKKSPWPPRRGTLPYYPPIPADFIDTAPLVCQTILDMFIDLPPLGSPSRNIEFVLAALNTDLFPFLCSRASRNHTARHLAALFGNLASFKPPRRYEGCWLDVKRYHTPVNPPIKEPCPKQHTYWFGIKSEVWFVAGELPGNYLLKDNEVIRAMLRRSLGGGVDAVRGPGILGLERPSSLGHNSVWDWANIHGQWVGLSSSPETGRGSVGRGVQPHQFEGPAFNDPEVFHLLPTLDVAGIREGYRTSIRMKEGIWVDFPLLEPESPDASLPPLFFYGYSQQTIRDRPAKFISGVVQLTHDSPPELRWNCAVHDFTQRRYRDKFRIKVFQGIQLGGRGAKRAVFGAWKYCKVGTARPPEFQGQETDGMLWFSKMGDEDDGEA